MDYFQVEFFETISGKQPVKEFLLSLNTRIRAETVDMISILQLNGLEMREPFAKHLENGIFELRCRKGKDKEVPGRVFAAERKNL